MNVFETISTAGISYVVFLAISIGSCICSIDSFIDFISAASLLTKSMKILVSVSFICCFSISWNFANLSMLLQSLRFWISSLVIFFLLFLPCFIRTQLFCLKLEIHCYLRFFPIGFSAVIVSGLLLKTCLDKDLTLSQTVDGIESCLISLGQSI